MIPSTVVVVVAVAFLLSGVMRAINGPVKTDRGELMFKYDDEDDDA